MIDSFFLAGKGSLIGGHLSAFQTALWVTLGWWRRSWPCLTSKPARVWGEWEGGLRGGFVSLREHVAQAQVPLMAKPRIGTGGLALGQPPYTARRSGLLSTDQICFIKPTITCSAQILTCTTAEQ